MTRIGGAWIHFFAIPKEPCLPSNRSFGQFVAHLWCGMVFVRMSMFRFEAIKPEIQEVIQEKEVSKDALRHIFFYSLLELERLRSHILNLESEIDYEGDLYLLMNLGARRDHTSDSIARREELTRRVFPRCSGGWLGRDLS